MPPDLSPDSWDVIPTINGAPPFFTYTHPVQLSANRSFFKIIKDLPLQIMLKRKPRSTQKDSSTLRKISLLAFCFAQAVSAQTDFTWIEIPSFPRGVNEQSVNYVYRLSRDETNQAQWVEFLNAKASNEDPHGLYYSTSAPLDAIITKTTEEGVSQYSTNFPKRPISFVKWRNALRFINWLHNGKGNGDTENGVYDLSLPFPTRQDHASYFLPSYAEWMKAAYFDPSTEQTWEYPTGSDTQPSTFDVNYDFNGSLWNQVYNDVDSTGTAISSFGAKHMAGNVEEWIESPHQSLTDRALVLGGSAWDSESSFEFYRTRDALSNTSSLFAKDPEMRSNQTGFRVAARLPVSQTTQPKYFSGFAGDSLLLIPANPSGTGPFTYQWFIGQPGDDSQPIAGATGITYEIPTLDSNQTYWRQASDGVTSDSGAPIEAILITPYPNQENNNIVINVSDGLSPNDSPSGVNIYGPEGSEFIVWTQGGELYSHPLGSGTRKHLTAGIDSPDLGGNGGGDTTLPSAYAARWQAWTHASGNIFFKVRDFIYQVPLSGGTPLILNPSTPASTTLGDFRLSHNADTLFFRTNDQSLYSVPATGGPTTQIVDGTSMKVRDQFVITPDGSRLVFIGQPSGSFDFGIYAVPVSGGPVTQLNNPASHPSGSKSIETFAVNASSQWVVYTGDDFTRLERDLFSVRIDGSQRQLLQDEFFSGSFWLTPDGTRVVFPAKGSGNVFTSLFSKPVSGGSRLAHTPAGVSVSSPQFDDVSISENSQWIFTTRSRYFNLADSIAELGFDFSSSLLPITSKTATGEIFIPLRPLTENEGFQKSQSIPNNGGVIIGNSATVLGLPTYYKTGYQGENPVNLVAQALRPDSRIANRPIPSRDGTHALVRANGDRSNQFELFSVSLTDGSWRRLHDHQTNHTVEFSTNFNRAGPIGDGNEAWFVADYETDGHFDLFISLRQAREIDLSVPREIIISANTSPGPDVPILISGNGPMTFQWFEGESGDLSSPVIDGTSATLSLPSSPSASRKYWVQVSNPSITVNSPTVLVHWTEAPASITLANTSLAENLAPLSIPFSIGDADNDPLRPGGPVDSHTIELIGGPGDDDNARYLLQNNQLILTTPADHEDLATHQLRLRVTDRFGLTFEENLNIQIIDDRLEDTDQDGLTEEQEEDLYQTSDLTADTDSDGFGDLKEITLGTDPTDPTLSPILEEKYQTFDPDAAAGNEFGRSVAIDGGYLLIGSIYDDEVAADGGSASILQKSTGQTLHKVTAPIPTAGARFGWEVAIDGNVGVTSAPWNSTEASAAGAAHILNLTDGTVAHTLYAPDAAADDLFGYDVAIGNGVVAVSAINNNNKGAVYLFNSSNGNFIRKITSFVGTPGDHFGSVVKIHDNKLAVTSNQDNLNGINSGSMTLFDLNTGNELWRYAPADGAAGEFFGESLEFDEQHIIVGAHADELGGSAYVLDTNTGTFLRKLTATDASQGDRFGHAVTLCGNIAAVSALIDNHSQGSVYYFDILTGSQLRKTRGSSVDDIDYFGFSIDSDDDSFIIGAQLDDDFGDQSGSAYLYQFRPAQPDIKITAGNGSEQKDGDLIEFPGRVVNSAPSPERLMITNDGESPLTGISAEIIGDHPSDFSINGQPPSTLAPLNGGPINFLFKPTAPGPRHAILRITSNDPDENSVDLLLKGQGVSPIPVAVSHLPLNSWNSDITDLIYHPVTESISVAYNPAGSTREIRIATDSGGSWIEKTAYQSPNAIFHDDIVLAANPTNSGMGLTFADRSNDSINLSTFDGSTWSNQIVASGTGIQWSQPFLTYDQIGQSHLLYYRAGGDLHYKSGGSTSVFPGTLAFPTPAAIHPIEGTPHFARVINANGDLYFTSRVASPNTWQSSLVEASSGFPHFNGDSADLKFGSDGHPVISYFESNTREIRLATSDGNSWSVEKVFTADSASIGRTRIIEGPNQNKYIIATIPDDQRQGEQLLMFWKHGSSWLNQYIAHTSNLSFGADGDGASLWIAYHSRASTNRLNIRELFLPDPVITVNAPNGTALDSGVNTIDFGPRAIGDGTSYQEFQITNIGTGDLLLGEASISQNPQNSFSITQPTTSNLAAGESTSFRVFFNPYASETYTGNISLLSNDADFSPFTFQVTGAGVTPEQFTSSIIANSGLSGSSAEPEATPFNDGTSNLLKVAFNMDLSKADNSPLKPNGNSGLPVAQITEIDGQTYWRLEFVRRKGSGLNYFPEKSSGLDPNLFEAMIGARQIVDLGDTMERVIVNEPCDPTVLKKCFSRVRVTLGSSSAERSD